MSLQLQCDWLRNDFRLCVDAQLPTTGITALFGRSGSGKSSVLRLIAGLENVSGAQVIFQQQRWQHGKHFVPPARRRIGLVLQQPGLFAHLSVLQNLRYGYDRVPAVSRRFELRQVIDWLQLDPLLAHPVTHLSGGQQQRVALGRALLASPQLLLLDEPFAGLDDHFKRQVLPLLRQFVLDNQLPVYLVSHDTREVEALADHLVFLQRGRISAQQTLQQSLQDLASPLFADADVATVLTARVAVAALTDPCKTWQLSVGSQQLLVTAPPDSLVPDCASQTRTAADPQQQVRLRIMARDVSIALAPVPGISIQNQLQVRIGALRPYQQQMFVSLILLKPRAKN
jgi:molybdate transport system ATP-binding protein